MKIAKTMKELYNIYGTRFFQTIVNQNDIINILKQIRRDDLIDKHVNQWLYIEYNKYREIITLYYSGDLETCIPLVINNKIYKEKGA